MCLFDTIFILKSGRLDKSSPGDDYYYCECSYSPILVAVHYISIEHTGHWRLTLTEEDVINLYE